MFALPVHIVLVLYNFRFPIIQTSGGKSQSDTVVSFSYVHAFNIVFD